MNLHKAVKDYVEMRRALGYKLSRAAVLLPQFVDFLQQQGSSVITIPLALQWAQSNRQAQPAEWAQRLTIVRCFARHWSATDPRTQIPCRWRIANWGHFLDFAICYDALSCVI
jgi:integrase/recombinase XerD